MDSDSAQHQKYDINSAREHTSIDFESASLQTVAAFAEFLRHSRGEDTPRLRTASHPGIDLPCSRARRLVLSGSFPLPEEVQVERAPLAPQSSRATETDESASSVVVYERSPRRDRSFSTTESQFPRLDPATFRVSPSFSVLLSCLKLIGMQCVYMHVCRSAYKRAVVCSSP